MADVTVRRSDDVVYEMSGDRAVLLDGTGRELITLNPVGSIVWNAMGDSTGPDALVAALAEVFPDVTHEQLADDVQAFLDELRDAGLILIDDARG